jgi:hypothetical protein
MAGKKFTTPDINLLPKAESANTPAGKFLEWALSWGKKIVILTELIVVLAFLSRFYFDTEVANLSEDIDHKKAIVESSLDFENEFRSVTNRVDGAIKIEKLPSTVLVLKSVEKNIPSSVSVTQINIDKDVVNFSGLGDDQSLAQMVANFRDSTQFKDLSLDKISKGESSGVNFSVHVGYIN